MRITITIDTDQPYDDASGPYEQETPSTPRTVGFQPNQDEEA
ncbi:hypothetical protein [Actinobaculum sp. 352]|nr:hypothetical protein [Actinobaculum sp. 352]